MWAQISTPAVLNHWMQGLLKKTYGVTGGGASMGRHPGPWVNEGSSAGDLSSLHFSWRLKWRKGGEERRKYRVDRVCKRRHHSCVCPFPLSSLKCLFIGLPRSLWCGTGPFVAARGLEHGLSGCNVRPSCPVAYGSCLPTRNKTYSHREGRCCNHLTTSEVSPLTF